MSYRKFSADYLFTGDQLLTGGQVLITDAGGTVIDIVAFTEGGDDIQALAGILCPGFVNTHCHLELSHLRGLLPEGTGMIDFLLGVMGQRFFPREQVLQAIALGEAEMLQQGIVAVGDICNTADTLAQKRLRKIAYHSFVEATGFVPATASQRFAQAEAVYQQLAAIGSASIVPHAPYSVSPVLLEKIAGFCGNKLLSIHNQESAAENEFLEKGTGDFHRLYNALGLDLSFYQATGRNGLQTFLPAFQPEQSLILVHNVVTSVADLQFVTKDTLNGPSLYWCLCPNANLYIGNGLPDIDLLRNEGCTITIGTDSLASNRQLSILEEMKTIQQHFPHIELRELLQWSTLNGARALQMEEELGSFEKGKKPGLVLIEKMTDNSFLQDATVKRLL